jgi:hypothetical protein
MGKYHCTPLYVGLYRSKAQNISLSTLTLTLQEALQFDP